MADVFRRTPAFKTLIMNLFAARDTAAQAAAEAAGHVLSAFGHASTAEGHATNAAASASSAASSASTATAQATVATQEANRARNEANRAEIAANTAQTAKAGLGRLDWDSGARPVVVNVDDPKGALVVDDYEGAWDGPTLTLTSGSSEGMVVLSLGGAGNPLAAGGGAAVAATFHDVSGESVFTPSLLVEVLDSDGLVVHSYQGAVLPTFYRAGIQSDYHASAIVEQIRTAIGTANYAQLRITPAVNASGSVEVNVYVAGRPLMRPPGSSAHGGAEIMRVGENYTVQFSGYHNDDGRRIHVTSNKTITLPDVGAARDGFRVWIVHDYAEVGNVTIAAGAGTTLITGGGDGTLSARGETRECIYHNGAWYLKA